jgi:hypothetical protein
MTDPRGGLILSAGGKEYRLHIGMSVLADLQAKHGQDVLSRLQPPPDAAPEWMPDLNVVVDLFLLALQRHHPNEGDRYLVDDLMAENEGAFSRMMQATFPEQAPDRGNGKRPRRAA